MIEQDLESFKDGEQRPCDAPCPRCGYRTYLERRGNHIGWWCLSCGYIKFVPQKWQSFIMPFGKYKGKKLIDLLDTDREYLQWCAENLDNEKIKGKIKSALDERMLP